MCFGVASRDPAGMSEKLVSLCLAVGQTLRVKSVCNSDPLRVKSIKSEVYLSKGVCCFWDFERHLTVMTTIACIVIIQVLTWLLFKSGNHSPSAACFCCPIIGGLLWSHWASTSATKVKGKRE